MKTKYALAVLLVSAAAFQAAHAAKVLEVTKDNRRMAGLVRGGQAPAKSAQAPQGASKGSTAAQISKSVNGKR